MSAFSFAHRRRLWPKSLAGKAGATLVYAFLLIAVFWFAALILTQRRLDRAIAEARSLGWTESWDGFVGPPIPHDENAAIPLIEAGKLASGVLDRSQVSRANLDRDDSLLLKTAASFIGDLNYQRLVDSADAIPRYRTTTVYGADVGLNQSALNHFYEVARMETAAAMSLMNRGNHDDAVRRSLRTLRITRKFTASEPWWLAQSIGHYARWMSLRQLNEVLHRAKLPAELHGDIEAELAKHDDADRVALRAADLSRTIHLDLTRGESGVYRSAITSPIANVDAAFIHERHNAYFASIGDSFRTAQPKLKVRHPLAGVPFPRGWRSDTYVMDSLLQARVCFDHSVALARCLRIINAMAAKGDFSAKLETLGLPNECLADPFDGERMRIMRTPDGPIVYSIGGDLKDDSGQLDDSKKQYDVGFGPVKPVKK